MASATAVRVPQPQAVWLARDSWRLMADSCPGLV